MYRVRSLAGADGRVFGNERTRLLRIYLSATTFLYTYGVVFTLFPVRTDLVYGNPIGGIIAIGLGVGSLVALAVRRPASRYRPWRPSPPRRSSWRFTSRSLRSTSA